MKKGFKILIVVILFLIAGGAVLFKYRVEIVSTIVPDIEQLENINISVINDTAYVSTKLIAKNKSFLPIKIDSITYKITLFDKVYLHEEKFLGIDMKGKSKDTFAFSLKIPVTAIIKDMKEERKKSDSASYTIEVAIQYSTIFGKAELPINKTSKLKIPKPPELEIIKVHYSKVRFKHILAEVSVKVTNFNDISLTVSTVNYSLNIIKHGIVEGKYTEPIIINPRSESFINLPIEVKWENTGQTVLDVMKDEDTYNYLLTFDAVVLTPDAQQKPIMIKVSKEGTMELRK